MTMRARVMYGPEFVFLVVLVSISHEGTGAGNGDGQEHEHGRNANRGALSSPRRLLRSARNDAAL
jgi:hypothetical protein